jgi:DNA uptake protein ComE-like DNA-binding protein
MGVVAMVFLVIGYQTAMFVHRAAVMRIEANRDQPDTVIICRTEVKTGKSSEVAMSDEVVRKKSDHSSRVEAVRQSLPRRKVESFRFDPNAASHEDLCRLGFSSRQAQSIINYREKGGRFRRKSDFAKSFVVADSVYARLEPYIDIPLLDLNLADSAAFDGLPGIGGYFASKMVSYREQLKGYSYKEQLMDIWRFDQEKFEAISDLVVVSPENITPYPLWTYPADSLRRHPYIRNYETARAIVLYRENTPPSQWSIKEISAAGILSESAAEKLSRCHIAAQ